MRRAQSAAGIITAALAMLASAGRAQGESKSFEDPAPPKVRKLPKQAFSTLASDGANMTLL